MCGENIFIMFELVIYRGSPPRVRGKRRKWCTKLGSRRITPACAGKTYVIRVKLVCVQDHPRVCGENSGDTGFTRLTTGSPPRVRGKLPAQPRRSLPSRITPACAGKTAHCLGSSAASGDHPRVCGENTRKREKKIRPRGSPPRVRGKQRVNVEILVHDRITPACAGKTCRN